MFKVNDYDTYTRSMKYSNPYSDNSGFTVNSDVSTLFQNDFAKTYSPLPIEKKRSNLDRALDFISMPLYVTAGAVKGMIDPNSTVLGNMWNGVKAGNPFGEGFDKGETTYSKVLETAGWKPTSTLGKITKGTLGFIGDIFLDPSTYFTLGGSALLKGTGKAGLAIKEGSKIAEVAKKLNVADDALKGLSDVEKVNVLGKNAFEQTVAKYASNPNINPDLVKRLAQKKADDVLSEVQRAGSVMTNDIAKEIITSNAAKRGVPLSAEEITRDSENLVKTYNKVAGVNRTAEGITLSLANAPFGKKLFGNLADKSLELVSGEKLMSWGDKTAAPVYAKLRDSIYGSKLGSLFSSTSALYKASKTDPAKVYDFLKFTEYTRGLTKDQLEAEKLIRDKAKAMNFTPSETKEVLNLMQDKSVWGKVKQTVNFLDTAEAKQYKERILKQREDVSAKLNELSDVKKNIDLLQHANESNIVDATDALDNLNNNYNRELFQLDTSRITKSEDIQKTLNMYETELKKLDNEIASSKQVASSPKAVDEVAQTAPEVANDYIDSIKMFDEYKNQINQRSLEKEAHKTLVNTLTEASDKEVFNSVHSADVLTKADEMSNVRYKKMINEINTSGKVTYKTKKSADSFERFYPTWERITNTVDGKVVHEFVPPQEVAKEFKKANLDPSIINSTRKVDRIPVVQKISEQIFGDKDIISKVTWDSNIERVVQMMKDGVSKQKIQEYIEENAKFFNGKAQVMYPFIAEQLGYGAGTKFKSWEEMYKKPIEELYKKVEKNGGKVTAQDSQKLLELQQLNFKRQYWINQFEKSDGVKGAMQIVQAEADRQLEELYYGAKGLYSTSYKGAMSVDEMDRNTAKFMDDSRASVKMGGNTANVEGFKHLEGIDSTRQDIYDEVVQKVFNQGTSINDIQDINKMRPYIAWANKVTDGIEITMEKIFPNRAYADLTAKQKDMVYSIASKTAMGKDEEVYNAIAKEIDSRAKLQKKQLTEEEGMKQIGDILGKDEKVVNDVNKTVDNTEEVIAKQAEEKASTSEITADVLNRRDEVMQSINETKDALKSLDVEYKTNYSKLLDGFTNSAEELKGKIKDLEETNLHLTNATKTGDLTQIEELTKKLNHMDDVLSSDDAMETFLRTWLGDNKVENIVRNSNPEIGKIVLDTMPVSDKVKNLVKVLRNEFKTIGREEIGIGKLKPEQFDALMDEYVTHILTPEGERFFANQKEIKKIIPSFGDDLGYGRKFNPYSLSRKIHDLPMSDGSIVHNPTIEQINEFFKPFVEGKNVMSESVADIYLARAMKHTELMYDWKYMNTMMNHFGKVLGKDGTVEDGYTAVANYGKLKEYIKDRATLLSNLEIETLKQSGAKIEQGQFRQLLEKHTVQFIDDLGLDPHVLDDLATPMVELNKEQISKINKFNPDLMRQVNDVIVQKANQARKLQIAKDQSKFLQIYDKFTHFIKLNQTTVLPSFHIRNKFSNTFNNWLNIGVDAVNPTFQKRSFLAIKNNGDVEGVLKITKEDGSFGAISWKELYENAKKYGVVDDGYFAKDVGAEASSYGLIKKIPGKFDPTDTKNFILYKKGAAVGSLIEGQDRLIHFASEVSHGKSFEQASESVNKFLFDYSDLTAFESTYMKRIIPYYTWLRKNSILQLNTMLEQPKKFQYVSKVLGGINGMTNEEDKMNKAFVNDFAQDWVQLPFSVTNPAGKQEPVMLNPNLPFMDISRIPNPFHPIDSIKNLFTQTNPMIKVPVEEAINKNVFFDQPIVKEGDNAVAKRADHVASQFALYGVLNDLINKNGADWGLQVLNTATGVKAVSYDYDKYKAMKISEIKKSLDNSGKSSSTSTSKSSSSTPAKDVSLSKAAKDIMNSVDASNAWRLKGNASSTGSTNTNKSSMEGMDMSGSSSTSFNPDDIFINKEDYDKEQFKKALENFLKRYSK